MIHGSPKMSRYSQQDRFCERYPPPSVTSFTVNEVAATHATIEWTNSNSLYHFFYEINYKISDAQKWISFTLPDFEKSVTLRGLKPRANYTAVLSTANQCLRTNGAPIHFVTAPIEIHPAITNVMSHEIFLIFVVLLLWFVIIAHFFTVFVRVTMFSSLSTPGLYFERGGSESSRKKSADSECSQGSQKASKAQNVLEDAVSTWRSETVLSKVELLDGMEAHRLHQNEPDRVSLGSEGNEADRRHSAALLSMVRSHSDGEGTLMGNHNSSLALNSTHGHGREVSFYLPQRKKFSVLESAEAMKKKIEEEKEEKRLKRQEELKRKRQSFAFGDRPGSKRKISEVLLGKATNDIRRCSSPGNLINLERRAIRKRYQRRRKSLLQTFNFGSNLRRSFRAMRNKYRRRHMDSVHEDSHENSPSWLDKDTPQFQLDTPPRKVSIAFQNAGISQSLQNSCEVPMEAFVTPRDIVINIDDFSSKLSPRIADCRLETPKTASGPSEYVGREGEYIAKIKQLEGVDLDPARIEFNPGRRFLSKLKLNTLWGKVGQRPDQIQYSTTRAEEIKSLGYAGRSIWTHEIKHMLSTNADMRRFFESQAHVTNRLTPRNGFYGGMSKAMKIYHKINDDEEIKYLDVCSLYPYVNRMVKYMLGAPKVITDFDAFQVMTGEKLNFIGFIFCLILPPSKHTHPVLPIKANGNLHFTLCKTCCLEENGTGICNHSVRERSLEGVWTSYEVNKALANGYVLQETYEVHAWDRWSESGFKNDNVGCNDKPLFAGYIEANLKPKLEASGYPNECVGREDEYRAKIKELEGVDLDPARIEFNPGRRFLSKLKLNALWGKVGQRPDQVQVKFFYKPEDLHAILNDTQNEIISFRTLGDEMGVIRYRTKDEFVQTKRWTSPAIAAWATACARLILLDHLETVGDRAIYCDTDSVVFVQKKGENLLANKIHTALEGLTDEEPDHDIVEIVCLGPKQYAYKAISKTNPQEPPKYVVKLRVISLTHLASAKINFDTMVDFAKDLLSGNPITPVRIDERKIVRRDRQMILTRDQVKQYQPVNKKGFMTPDDIFRPYGY